MERGIPVVLRAEWQENSDKPCDTGSSISEMQKEWPQFDWSSVDPIWPAKTGLYRFSREGLTERGIAARDWLRNRPEKVIAVVSHSGFLRVGVSNKGYYNADYRVFEFAEGHEEVGGKLVELEVTEKKGGGLGKSNHGTYFLGPGMESLSFFLVGSCYKWLGKFQSSWLWFFVRKLRKWCADILVGDYPDDDKTPVEEAVDQK